MLAYRLVRLGLGHWRMCLVLIPWGQSCWHASQSFVQKERLDSAEAWYCPKCKEHVQATKKLDLWSAPEILILHLKRFQYTTQSRRKIDAPVAFPLANLDLSPYLIHQQVYGLTMHRVQG